MVFETLMFFNGLLCAGVGWILLIFMAKPAGLIGALIFWAAATLLWEGKRYVDRLLPFDGSHHGRSRPPQLARCARPPPSAVRPVTRRR